MRPTVIALGFFDGVHLGHGALLRRTVERAEELDAVSAVFTFSQSPKEVVTGIPSALINTPEDRAGLMRRLYGVEEIFMVPFDEEMMTTPWDRFLTEILAERYHTVHLVAGHDYHFGYRNQGTPELLRDTSAALGIGCDIIPKVELGGITVSSTYIRRLIELGQVERARAYLGHPHVLTRTVAHGRRIGHTIGAPTVNLTPPHGVLLPCRGVYAGRAVLEDGAVYDAVVNVGTRPTVANGNDVTVEAWMPDFSGDLYGQQVRLEFHYRLRDEIRFDSLDALRDQIASDAETAKRLLGAETE